VPPTPQSQPPPAPKKKSSKQQKQKEKVPPPPDFSTPDSEEELPKPKNNTFFSLPNNLPVWNLLLNVPNIEYTKQTGRTDFSFVLENSLSSWPSSYSLGPYILQDLSEATSSSPSFAFYDHSSGSWEELSHDSSVQELAKLLKIPRQGWFKIIS